jgi:hypothetical protein
VTGGECQTTVCDYPLGCSGPRQSGCAGGFGVNQDRDSLHAFCALVVCLATTADTSDLTSSASIPAQAQGATHGRTGTRGAAVPRQHSARGRLRNAAHSTAKGARSAGPSMPSPHVSAIAPTCAWLGRDRSRGRLRAGVLMEGNAVFCGKHLEFVPSRNVSSYKHYGHGVLEGTRARMSPIPLRTPAASVEKVQFAALR